MWIALLGQFPGVGAAWEICTSSMLGRKMPKGLLRPDSHDVVPEKSSVKSPACHLLDGPGEMSRPSNLDARSLSSAASMPTVSWHCFPWPARRKVGPASPDVARRKEPTVDPDRTFVLYNWVCFSLCIVPISNLLQDDHTSLIILIS